MISTLLAENIWFYRAALLGVQVLAVILAVALARGGHQWSRTTAIALSAIGLLAVVALTLLPDGTPEPPPECNLEPYGFYTDVPNMTLFFVPALFAVIATRRPVVVAIVAMLLSASIELVQSAAWLGRRCDIDDLLANSLGGLLAVAIGALVVRLNRQPSGSARPEASSSR